MADVTKFIELDVFQWSRPDAENPRLSAPITDAETTLLVTHPPLDKDGKIVANAFIMGAQNEKGYVESIYVPANAVQGFGNVPDSTNLGLTITGVTRGINLSGLDIDTAVSGLAVAHNTNSVIFNNISAINFTMMRSALMGQIGSGGNVWKIGDETDVDSKVYAFNGDADKPYWGYDSAGSKWIYSNDGVSSTDFGTGAGVTGGDGITVTAGDIDVDLTDTTTFRTTRDSNESVGIVTDSATGLIANSFLGMAGVITAYGGASAPTGWLLCDGTTGKDSVTDTTLAALYAIIGTTYGGTGADDFDLPDLRERVPVGVKLGGTFNALADTGGSETHTLTETEMPSHTHTVEKGTASGSNAAAQIAGNATYITSDATGGDGAHNNLQPYLVINYIIKK